MNEYERLRRLAQRHKENYPPGTRIMLLNMNSGSVSRSKNDPSASLQMIERPLMTPDELKSMPKGQFVVMKTGEHPMKVKLKLFFKWGIQFDEEHPYTVADNGSRRVAYAEKKEIIDGIIKKYRPELLRLSSNAGSAASGQGQPESQRHDPQRIPPKKTEGKKSGGASLAAIPRSYRHPSDPLPQAKTSQVESLPSEPAQKEMSNEQI